MSLVEKLKESPFLLAPMAGITDHAFRSFMKQMGAGIVVSELVSATGLEYKSTRTRALMSFSKDQHPVGIQLFGENPLHLAFAAKEVETSGADFVDLNFGCPVPKVVKKGGGSAMLKDLPAMEKVLKATVAAVKIPVTIKIRTGWDANTRNALQVVRLANDCGISWVAIHGRTRAQGYEGHADWEYIGEIKAKSALPIIGNGDVVSAYQAVRKLREYSLDGVMIGRGALKNPYIFLEANEKLQNKSSGMASKSLVQAFTLLSRHLMAHCENRILQIQLKKFAAWYSTGYSGSAQFRKNIFQIQTTEKTMEAVLKFLEAIDLQLETNQETLDNEGFLMGGHG